MWTTLATRYCGDASRNPKLQSAYRLDFRVAECSHGQGLRASLDQPTRSAPSVIRTHGTHATHRVALRVSGMPNVQLPRARRVT